VQEGGEGHGRDICPTPTKPSTDPCRLGWVALRGSGQLSVIFRFQWSPRQYDDGGKTSEAMTPTQHIIFHLVPACAINRSPVTLRQATRTAGPRAAVLGVCALHSYFAKTMVTQPQDPGASTWDNSVLCWGWNWSLNSGPLAVPLRHTSSPFASACFTDRVSCFDPGWPHTSTARVGGITAMHCHAQPPCALL
jgi:hypothetical protein